MQHEQLTRCIAAALISIADAVTDEEFSLAILQHEGAVGDFNGGAEAFIALMNAHI